MDEKFVSEIIKPLEGTFDTAAMTRGEPGLPAKFIWRDTGYTIAEVLEVWKETGACRSGGRETYLRKHWYKIRTTDNIIMTLYFERQARSKSQNKARWWLYTIEKFLLKGENMNQMTAFCGLICSDCGAFIATRNNDDEKKAEVAKLWSGQYHVDLKPSDINCDGCTSDGDRLIGHCHVCEIRKCGKQKGVQNCAYCDDYKCEKLDGFFKMVPDAKKHLDEIRSKP